MNAQNLLDKLLEMKKEGINLKECGLTIRKYNDFYTDNYEDCEAIECFYNNNNELIISDY